jgi:hypothetical protein
MKQILLPPGETPPLLYPVPEGASTFFPAVYLFFPYPSPITKNLSPVFESARLKVGEDR